MLTCLGLIRGAGDAADAVLGYTLVIRKAKKAEYVLFLNFFPLQS